MPADAPTEVPVGRESVGALPVGHPVPGPAGNDGDLIFRAGRAHLAKLSLELRAVLHEAKVAERAGGTSVHAEDALHGVALDHLRTSLGARLAARRSELAAEVERARSEATRRVAAARAEASALVASAREEPSRVPAEPIEVSASTVVHEAPAPARNWVGADSVVPVSPRAPYDDWPFVPEPRDRATLTSAAPVEPAPSTPPAQPPDPEAVAQPAPQPRTTGAPNTGAPNTDARNARSRFLHVDVLLPLIAGLAVLVVLLAELG